MKRILEVLTLAAALAPGVAAQRDATARLAGRVPPAVVTVVQGLVDTAAARGLPATPLVDKALEGAAKGVPPDRIVSAVRTVFGQLGAAADALRGAGLTSGDAIEAGAFALAAGLDAGDVADIARTADRSYPTATALQVAGTLAALGVPPGRVVGLVEATIRSGRPVGDLVTLPSQVQAAMAGGIPPAAAAAGLERAVAAHVAPRPRGQGNGQGNPHKP